MWPFKRNLSTILKIQWAKVKDEHEIIDRNFSSTEDKSTSIPVPPSSVLFTSFEWCSCVFHFGRDRIEWTKDAWAKFVQSYEESEAVTSFFGIESCGSVIQPSQNYDQGLSIVWYWIINAKRVEKSHQIALLGRLSAFVAKKIFVFVKLVPEKTTFIIFVPVQWKSLSYATHLAYATTLK